MLGGAGWIVCSLEQSLELILGPDGVEVKPKFEPDKLGYDPPPPLGFGQSRIGRDIISPQGNIIDRDITWVYHVRLRQ